MYQEEVDRRWEKILRLLAEKVDGRTVKWEKLNPERSDLYAASTHKLTYVIYPLHGDAEHPFVLEVRDSTGNVIATLNTGDASDDLAMNIGDLWNSIHMVQSTEIGTLDEIIADLEPPF